jgi:hypothetical protein
MTTYLYEEIFQEIEGDPDNLMLTVPEEYRVGWLEGDTISIVVKDGTLILRNLSKEKRRVEVVLDLPENLYIELLKMAHERDVTLNTLVETILREAMDKLDNAAID